MWRLIIYVRQIIYHVRQIHLEMRNSLIVLFLFISFTISGATYYIDPSGNDFNSGSSSSPWKTLAYACSKATASGDIIHVNAGTYTETNQCVLAVGVSIEGNGVTSHIISRVTFTRFGDLSGAAITCSSASEGTNGNQHISNIKLDGDYYGGTTSSNSATGNAGILVQKRSNVKIYNCTIVGFYLNGVAFHGSTLYQQPSIYATGNEIYNCILTGNGDTDNTWGGGGQIEIGSQNGTLIHDNTIDGTTRSVGHNGNFLSGAYYNKGIKVYNNISTKLDNEGGAWNFHIEMWNTDGGFEVYNNKFWGGDTGIDIAGVWNVKGNYDYSWYIHDNLFTGTAYASGNGKYCIDLENKLIEDVWIYRNHFLNRPSTVNVTNGTTANSEIRRIYICYNIMENCGWENPDLYHVIMNFRVPGDMIFEDIYIYNNVILGDVTMYTTAIALDNSGSGTYGMYNINIKNNIIVHNQNVTWLNVANNGTINGLQVNNNIIYNNKNNDPVFTGSSVSNYQFLNNQKVDPLFVSSSDFHLQAGSPAIGKGLSIAGLTTDYVGKTLNIPPSIGAYESGSAVTSPTIPVYQNSVVANATPSLLEMTYNLSLANVVPAASAFKVLVNSVATTVTTVGISGTKVQLTLVSGIKFGDIVTISYTKPVSNPLQTATGGQPISITAQSIINNIINPVKDATLGAITMTISPNHIHRIINVLLQYTTSFSILDPAMSPQIIRIFDTTGKLFIEKLLVTGIPKITIPINLRSGIYSVLMFSGGFQLASQKILVY